MKTDVEIAQEAVIEPIQKIAAKLGIDDDNLELYGKYKAKFGLVAYCHAYSRILLLYPSAFY